MKIINNFCNNFKFIYIYLGTHNIIKQFQRVQINNLEIQSILIRKL